MDDARTCPSCGFSIPSAARFCGGCGRPLNGQALPAEPPGPVRPGGGGWNPQPPAQPPAASRPAPDRPRAEHQAPVQQSGGAAFEGEVRSLQVRTEQLANKQTEEIWTFRVERFDDAGKRVALMPVEMRGETFHGSISEGERVRVVGRMRAGTLYATGLENLSTGAGVRVKKAPVLPKVIFAIIFLAVLGWIAYAAYMATTSGNGSSNGLLLPPIGGL